MFIHIYTGLSETQQSFDINLNKKIKLGIQFEYLVFNSLDLNKINSFYVLGNKDSLLNNG